MVKTPRTRHSNTTRDPVTIELGPDEVSHVSAEDEAAPASDSVKEDIGASEAAAESPDATSDVASASETPSEAAQEPASAFADESAKPAEEAQAAHNEPPQQPRPSFAESEPRIAPPPSRPSRGTALTAGLAGGVVALLAGGLLQFAGVLGTPGPGGSPTPAVPASVETDIAALKSEIDGLKVASGNAG